MPLAEDVPLRETRYPYRDLAELNFEFQQDYDRILVEQALMQHLDIHCTILRCTITPVASRVWFWRSPASFSTLPSANV
ncbi:hypothetical protein [Oculatella sp. LEGE 06141]|uniref:hypothetical protein n=1 Tax=Oculatella sp. LEGE 06141 TaxID=1828648 RepID=UPI0030D95D09